MLRFQVDSLFRISHTDPWVGGDVHRTSRTINFQVPLPWGIPCGIAAAHCAIALPVVAADVWSYTIASHCSGHANALHLTAP